MIDFELTPSQRALVAQAHEFARDVLRPAEIELDRVADPEAVFTSKRFWSVMREAYRLGYHKMSFPTHFGGLGLDQVTAHLITEELLWGAPGITQGIVVGGIVPFTAMMSGRSSLAKEFTRRYCEEGEVHFSAMAGAESHIGSDIFYVGDKTVRFRTTARKVGDDYVLNGSKVAWVTNGGIATMLAVPVCVEPERGILGTGVFLLPGDLPGISRGKPLDKLGLRCLNQSEVFFEDVKVHKRYLAVRPQGENWLHFVYSFVCFGQILMGQSAVALMRAAYEIAFAHAGARVQGGKPIIEHPNIALKLFDAHCTIEAARSVLLKGAWLNATRFPGDFAFTVAARCFPGSQVPRVITEMIQVMGAYGITKDCAIEKLYRDAKLTQIEDGALDTVGLEAMRILRERETATAQNRAA